MHIYAELRLPFDAALDAAEADLFARAEQRARKRPHGGQGRALTGVTLSPPIFLNAAKVNRIKADSYKRYNGRDDL